MPVTIRRAAYDAQNVELQIHLVRVDGDRLVNLRSIGVMDGWQEITYTPTVERAKMYGASREPRDRTRGVADYEGNLTMQFYWWRVIRDHARDLNIGLFDLEMNIDVVFYRPGIPIAVDTIYRAAIRSPETAISQGADPVMVPVELDVMSVYYDGRNGWNETLT
jgi:hypothetical protein